MSASVRLRYPVRLPHFPPAGADRLREELSSVLDDQAYFMALLLGRSGVTPALRGTISLTADGIATSTTITSDHVTADSLLVLTAQNAGAAAEVGTAAGVYVTYTTGVATIHHSASVSARSFRYLILP